MRLNDDVALDVGPEEALVGIEILDASHVLGEGESPAVELINVSSVAGTAVER